MPTYEALCRVPYGGRYYHAGEPFEATEKQGDLLVKIKKARRIPAANKTDLPKPAKVEEAPVQPEAPLHQSYLRRDMQASPIGEDNPSPSSRRGRPPKVRTSASFEDDSE
jgi:hypothetical protein